MKLPRFIIQIDDQRFRIAQNADAHGGMFKVLANEAHEVCSLPRTAGHVEALAHQLAGAMKSHLPAGATGCMVLPAHWCLIQLLTGPHAIHGEESAAFEFERFSPLPIEELTCTFWHPTAYTTFVVGVCTSPMRDLISAIEQGGYTLDSLTVDLCLPLEPAGQTEPGRRLMLLKHRHANFLITGITADSPQALRSVRLPESRAMDHVRNELRVSMEMAGLASVDIHLVCTTDRWDSDACNAVLPEGSTLISYVGAGEASARIFESATERHVIPNLRIGPLRSPTRWQPILIQLQRCAIVAIALIMVLTIRFWFEGRRFVCGERTIHAGQESLFRELFPESAMAAGEGLRIQSERIRLEGLTRNASSNGSLLEPGGMVAFALLHELTQRLPKAARVNIEEILLDRNGIRVAGLTTGHHVVGEWVKELNSNSTITADPPRTRLRSDGAVEFRVQVRQTEVDHDQ